MDDICRLCCSKNFVNNSIFDEENALYLKMSLYLPIKVFKNDRLPQKVCDKCSCKVNDFYQFCNETIEVQNRLRSFIISSGISSEEVVDLTRIKENVSPLPGDDVREQSTQTDWATFNPCNSTDNQNVHIKEEPTALSPIKEENVYEEYMDSYSDNSDNISLITLKKKKRSKKSENGIARKTRKKKSKLDNLEILMNSLPEETNLSVVDEGTAPVKQEISELLKPIKIKDFNVRLEVKHVKKEVGELEVFNCCICMMQCFSKNEMIRHYRTHANEAGLPAEPPAAPLPPDMDPLRCLRCRKALTAGEWAAHWRRHWERDRRPYRCTLCEKTFRDPHQILKHGVTHKYTAEGGAEAGPEGGAESAGDALNKRFICDLCPESFVYMRYLQAHRTRAHPEAAARALLLRCGVCGRQFAHLNSLRRHLRAHDGTRDHLCNVCGKALSSREHLKFHIRIHTGYKPNVCKTCGKGFVKKCNLTLHERVHSGEKPHVCSSCGKAFSQRSTLVIHERYHSGARPYSCPHCLRGFVAKGLLSMHLKTTCI